MSEFRPPQFVSLNFQKDILAKDIMARQVVSVSPSGSLLEVYQKFVQHGFSSLPVVENGLVVGVITEHDVISRGGGIDIPALVTRWLEHRLGGGDRGHLQIQFSELLLTVSKVMNPEPILLREDTKLATIFDTFSNHGEVNSTPIVNADGKLVGIISRSDLLKFIGEMLTLPIHVGITPSPSVGEQDGEAAVSLEHSLKRRGRNDQAAR